MSKKKSSKLNANYKKRAKALKKHKVINYDLRRKLTPAQKAAITRLWRGNWDADREGHHGGWGAILDSDDFIYRHVSNKRAKQLKKLGYIVHKNRVYIEHEGYDSIHIKDNRIIKGKDDKELIDYLIPNRNIFDQIKSRLDKKLDKGEFLTVRIGDNGMFQRKILTSYQSLYNYLERWSPKKDFNRRDELISKMSIVKYKV